MKLYQNCLNHSGLLNIRVKEAKNVDPLLLNHNSLSLDILWVALSSQSSPKYLNHASWSKIGHTLG
jgi:hypothetical protein